MALLAEAVIAKLTAFVEVVVLAPLARAHERDFIVGGGVAPLAEAVMVRLTTCVAVVGLAKGVGLRERFGFLDAGASEDEGLCFFGAGALERQKAEESGCAGGGSGDCVLVVTGVTHWVRSPSPRGKLRRKLRH